MMVCNNCIECFRMKTKISP